MECLQEEVLSDSEQYIDLCFEKCDDKADIMIAKVEGELYADSPPFNQSNTSSTPNLDCESFSVGLKSSNSSMKITSVSSMKKRSGSTNQFDILPKKKFKPCYTGENSLTTNEGRGNNKISKVENKSGSKFNFQSLILKNISKNKGRNYNGMKMLVNRKTNHYSMAIYDTKICKNGTIPLEPWMFDSPKLLKPSVQSLFVLPKAKHENHLQRNLHSECVSKEIHTLTQHEEGNMNILKRNYISLSKHLKAKHILLNERNETEDYSNLPNHTDGLDIYETCISSSNRPDCRVNVFSSWKKVQERIEAIQEETMTKFIYKFKTSGFSGNPPERLTKIYFKLDVVRRDVPIVIPQSNIPFTLVGVRKFDCHLGKKRKINLEPKTSSQKLGSKKIGCPAYISVAKIARFPDFSIAGLSSSSIDEVITELQEAWYLHSSSVRYYIEYYVREPRVADHKGHDLPFMTDHTRFQEPIDPRIQEEIRRLAYKGETKPKVIREKLHKFVRTSLFTGKDKPLLDRRRYKPTLRDIRYIILKEKLKLESEGKILEHVQFAKVSDQIQAAANYIKDKGTLDELISCMQFFRDVLETNVNLKSSLEAMKNALNEAVLSIPYANSAPSEKSSLKGKCLSGDVVLVPQSHSTGIDEKIFTGQLSQDNNVQQFYINVPDVTSTSDSVFGTQMYESDLVNINQNLDPMQTSAEDLAVAGVYYYYPDGSCELVAVDSLDTT